VRKTLRGGGGGGGPHVSSTPLPASWGEKTQSSLKRKGKRETEKGERSIPSRVERKGEALESRKGGPADGDHTRGKGTSLKDPMKPERGGITITVAKAASRADRLTRASKFGQERSLLLKRGTLVRGGKEEGSPGGKIKRGSRKHAFSRGLRGEKG